MCVCVCVCARVRVCGCVCVCGCVYDLCVYDLCVLGAAVTLHNRVRDLVNNVTPVSTVQECVVVVCCESRLQVIRNSLSYSHFTA